jgi:hypothetical protein
MRKIFLILTLFISFVSFGQDFYRGESKIGQFIFYYGQYGVPTNYQYRVVRERSIAAMFDSSLHVPRYNGTPVGLRTGSSTNDGLIAIDTLNHIFYYYSGGAWINLISTATNIYNTSSILTGNRTLTGLNNTYSLLFDSLNAFSVWRNGISRMSMNSSNSQIASPDGTNTIAVSDAFISLTQNSGSNYLYINDDSSLFHKRASYEGNIHSTFFPYSLVDKSYVDSVALGGSGTINSGTTGKPAYYVGATTLDDFIAVDYATSGTHVKIKAQALTDTVLQVTGASSQTAPLQVWENGSHTDLAYIEADGDLIFTASSGKQITGIGDEIKIRQTGDAFGESGIIVRNRSGSAGGVFYNSVLDLVDLGFLVNSGAQFNFRFEQRVSEVAAGNTAGEFQFLRSSTSNRYARFGEVVNAAFYGYEGADGVLLLSADESDDNADDWWLKSRQSNNDFTFENNTTEILRLTSTGALTMPEIAAPSTPASGYTSIYTKSDGLWYGKDDAGVETALSNVAGATPTLQQVLDAGSSLTSNETITVGSDRLSVTGSSQVFQVGSSSGGTAALNVYNEATSTNTIIPIVRLQRATTGTGAVGEGGKVQLDAQTTGGITEIASLDWALTNATHANRTAQVLIEGISNAVTDTLMTLGGYVNLTESSATQFTTTTIATGKIQGGEILITVEANDATDFQARTLRFIWSAVNKAGTLTITISTPEEVVAVSSGTLTCTITGVDNGSGVLSFKANAVSSLTQTTLRSTYQTFKNF